MIEEKYQVLCKTESDINKHLPIIRKYVSEGDVIVEMGVRECVSTWALLANKPSFLNSIDIVPPSQASWYMVVEAAKESGTTVEFIQASSLNVVMKVVDVLFIDTIHTYSQLVKELWAHESRVKKFLILHDTNIPEMRSCLTDFLYSPNWEIAEESKEHEGLTVLKRV